MWDIDSLNNIIELCSKRDVAIKCAKFLPPPEEPDTPSSPFANSRPLMALVCVSISLACLIMNSSSETNQKFPRTKVQLFSLRANQIVKVVTFLSEVFNVFCSPRHFLVVRLPFHYGNFSLLKALKDRIYVLHASTFEKIISLDTYPSPVPDQVIALGPRWLA